MGLQPTRPVSAASAPTGTNGPPELLGSWGKVKGLLLERQTSVLLVFALQPGRRWGLVVTQH